MGHFSPLEIILIDLWPVFLVLFLFCILAIYCCSLCCFQHNFSSQRDLENGAEIEEERRQEVLYAGMIPVFVSNIDNELYFSTSSSGSDEENSECSICLRPIKLQRAIEDLNYAKIIPCGHKFHQLCVESWENRGNADCPNCRTSFFTHWEEES